MAVIVTWSTESRKSDLIAT